MQMNLKNCKTKPQSVLALKLLDGADLDRQICIVKEIFQKAIYIYAIKFFLIRQNGINIFC